MRTTSVLPPTWLLVGLIAMGVLHWLLSGPSVVHGYWRLAGVAPALLGAVVTVWADALFKKHGTEVKPFKESSLVVRDGPFGFSRNPMYLGFMGILLGAAVLAGSLTPLLLTVVMFVLFSVLYVVPEERHMEQQFGDEYRRYKSDVRRWL